MSHRAPYGIKQAREALGRSPGWYLMILRLYPVIQPEHDVSHLLCLTHAAPTKPQEGEFELFL